jgi:CO/xanthine dehydrogenase Mo-binding subunit
MSADAFDYEPNEVERYELREGPAYRFETSRREFVQIMGAGFVIAASATSLQAQRGRGRTSRRTPLSERFHFAEDGKVTVFTSKVEVGQGSRTQITQAVAEELRLPVDQIELVMADTKLCPDDGGTAGSRTTPSTVPSVRAATAAARDMLVTLAAEHLKVENRSLSFRDGAFSVTGTEKKLTLAELAKSNTIAKRLEQATPDDNQIVRVENWKVLGTSVPKTTGDAVVTGAAKYPSDINRPEMLYGKVLRPPAYGAKLESIDLSATDAVHVVRDGDFVGCVAETSWQAAKAIEAIAKTAKWTTSPQVSSSELYDHLKRTARGGGGGRFGGRGDRWGQGPTALENAASKIENSYTIAYIQHAPMEPRAAVAEWKEGSLTVWTGSQQPSRVQGELSQAFRLPAERVRVIVPDTGGGFGGKHTGEAAVEAARLAKAANRAVSLRWTREEEFTWAYFRPAGLIEVRAGLDEAGNLHAWDFINYNSGGSAIGTPYRVPNGQTQFVSSESPLRQGSYRALASAANTFARESAMDELAALAKADPLEFRRKHLPQDRLLDVLNAAAERFGWMEKRANKRPGRGIGLACGTEKGSFTAACVEVEVTDKRIRMQSVCQAFECGAIQNPENLKLQVIGCLVMGLGGALSEEIEFKDGRVVNPRFSEYQVPRMEDVPEMDVVLLNRTDLPSLGAGETPIIAIAPAIANAVADAIGKRIRSMPIKL